MRLVVGDSSTLLTTVALRNGGQTVRREVGSGKSQSEKFLSLIDEVLRESELRPEDIDAFGLVEGPGSFTGLRIGFSVMKGLAFALKKPLYLSNRLDLMAGAVGDQSMCLPLVDAHRNSWYTALFQNGKRVSEYLDLEEPRLRDLLNDPVAFFSALNSNVPGNFSLRVCGEWPSEWKDEHPAGKLEWVSGEQTRRIDEVLLEALERDIRQDKTPSDLASAIPFYLRRSEAENLLAEKIQKKSPL